MIAKLKIGNEIVSISMPKVKSIDESRRQTLKLNEYKRFLTKLYKKHKSMTTGYYWVKYKGEWQIAHYEDYDWRLFYIERRFKTTDFEEVNTKQIVQ